MPNGPGVSEVYMARGGSGVFHIQAATPNGPDVSGICKVRGRSGGGAVNLQPATPNRPDVSGDLHGMGRRWRKCFYLLSATPKVPDVSAIRTARGRGCGLRSTYCLRRNMCRASAGPARQWGNGGSAVHLLPTTQNGPDVSGIRTARGGWSRIPHTYCNPEGVDRQCAPHAEGW